MGAVSSNVSGRNARMGGHNIPHIAHSILHIAHKILDFTHNIHHSSVQFIDTVGGCTDCTQFEKCTK